MYTQLSTKKNDVYNIKNRVAEMLHELNKTKNPKEKKLRTCQAKVVFTENYIILISYQTPVAFIDRKQYICFDILRIIYGYTATSQQHISKFGKDYSDYFLDEVRYYE